MINFEVNYHNVDIQKIIRELNKVEETTNKYHQIFTNLSSLNIVDEVNDINQDQFARLVKIIPPENINSEENWLSPWEIMDGREIGAKQQNILDILLLLAIFPT